MKLSSENPGYATLLNYKNIKKMSTQINTMPCGNKCILVIAKK